MRVRIVKPAGGIVDGVSLSRLVVGVTYDVPDRLGHYLVMGRFAEVAASGEAAVAVPNGDLGGLEAMASGGGVHVTQTDASDKPPRRRAKKR